MENKPKFIVVTCTHTYKLIYVNINHIVYYDRDSKTCGVKIHLMKNYLEVKETVEEITLKINAL